SRSSRSVKRTVFEENCVAINFELRKATRDVLGETPVGRYLATGQKTGSSETVEAGANRYDSPGTLGSCFHKGGDRFANLRFAQSATSRNNQRVQRRRVVKIL